MYELCSECGFEVHHVNEATRVELIKDCPNCKHRLWTFDNSLEFAIAKAAIKYDIMEEQYA